MYVRLKRKNQTVFMYCDGAETGQSLKTRLAQVIKKTPDEIQLLFNDKIVADDKTLQEQRIDNDNIVLFRFRQEGAH